MQVAAVHHRTPRDVDSVHTHPLLPPSPLPVSFQGSSCVPALLVQSMGTPRAFMYSFAPPPGHSMKNPLIVIAFTDSERIAQSPGTCLLDTVLSPLGRLPDAVTTYGAQWDNTSLVPTGIAGMNQCVASVMWLAVVGGCRECVQCPTLRTPVGFRSRVATTLSTARRPSTAVGGLCCMLRCAGPLPMICYWAFGMSWNEWGPRAPVVVPALPRLM